ncbi:hypothetical protein Tco_1015378 [Tanacetum coccineum]|uniref:Retrotransposon gag domain-containing protein n=1 Tax=Tanacetum coccineum TaxID=301880 RepID=A0ABQ5FKM6_9ASTR
MSTQQDIYTAGSETRHPMLNKEIYVPWSSRLLRYAKSRPNEKLIYNSIMNGPNVRRMIPEPGGADREVLVNETFHEQTDDELTEKELKQEIWLRVQQMMKGYDIGIQEKKAKLFNEWERFTSTDGESIESYYHHFMISREINTFQKRLPAISIIMEYLVNISKRRAFWSLNKDILKITVLTTNTPYPSRKIRCICACTHQRPRRKHDQYVIDEDVVNHIAKVLEMIDLIYIPGVDSHQLRMKVFPLSLADDVRQWWINEGEGKITVWEELVEKFFCKFYPESYDGEEKMLDEGDNWGIDPLEFISRVNSSFEKHMKMDRRTKKVLFHAWMNGSWNKRRMDDIILCSNDTTTGSFFRPYLKTSEKNETEKDNELSQTKRKCSNTSISIDEQPYKRTCKAEKFEAIKYSLGPNEEYIAIRRCEYDAWERNEDRMSIIYQEIFQKKDNGWKVTRIE